MFRAKSQSNKRPLRKSPFPTAASWQLIGSRWNRSTSSSSRPDACRTTWTITNDLMYEGAPIARYRICRTVFSSYLRPADLVVVDRDSFQLLDLPFWSPIKLFPFHFFFLFSIRIVFLLFWGGVSFFGTIDWMRLGHFLRPLNVLWKFYWIWIASCRYV